MDDQRQAAVVLTADNRGYDQSMAQSAQQTQGLESALDSLTQKLDKLAKGTGRKLTIFAAADIAAITGATVAAGSFEKQMEGLQAQSQSVSRTFDQGTRTFDKYASSVNRLRREFPTTTSEAAQLVQVISKLTDDTKGIDKIAASFTKLSGATGEAPAQLAQGVLQLTKQMGTGTRDIERYNNTVLSLSSNTQQSASALVDFTSTLAPAGRQLQISTTDLLGISAAFGKAGQDGNLAANAFNKMANDISYSIQSGSPDIKKYSDLIGVTIDQFKDMDKSDALVQIFEQLNKQGPDAIRTLERFGLEGQRNMRAIQAISQQQGGIGGAVRQARDSFAGGDQLDRASKSAFDGLSDQGRKFTESMKMNAEDFGKPFAQITTQFLKGATKMSDAANDLINGPLGALGQIFAGIAAPIALGAGALLKFGSALATVAAIRLAMGSGTGGFLSAMMGDRAPKFARTSTERFNNPDGYVDRKGNVRQMSWLQRGMYQAGDRAGNFMADRGIHTRMNREEYNRARNAGMPSNWSRAAGIPLRGAAFGMNLLADSFSPGWYGMPGYNGKDDPTQRRRLFNSPTFAGSMRSVRDFGSSLRDGAMLGSSTDRFGGDARRQEALERRYAHASRIGNIAGPQMSNGQFLSSAKAASDNMEQVSKSAKGAGASLGTFGKSLARMGGSLALTAAGTAATVAPPVGRGLMAAGGALMANPLMAGMLGLTAGSMIYDQYKDKSDAEDYKSYERYLTKSAEKAGVSGPNAAYTREDVIKRREEANLPETMSDAVKITGEDIALARMSGRELSDPRIGKFNSAEEALQVLAPEWADQGNLPPAQVAQVKGDLISTLGAREAESVLSQLQTGSDENYGNIASQVKFDPSALAGMNEDTKGTRKDMLNVLQASVEGRAAVAGRQFGDDAYDSTLRNLTVEGMNELVFGEDGMYRNPGSVWDNKMGMGIGGGQEAFQEWFNTTYGADVNIKDMTWGRRAKQFLGGEAGGASTANYDSMEDFIEAQIDLGTDMGSFYSQYGLQDPSKLEGGDRKRAIKEILKVMPGGDTALASGSGKETPEEARYKRLAEYADKGVADVILGRPNQAGGIKPHESVASFRQDIADPNNVYASAQALIKEIKGDKSTIELDTLLRQIQSSEAEQDEGDLATVARQINAQRMAVEMPRKNIVDQSQMVGEQYRAVAGVSLDQRGKGWAEEMQQADLAREQMRTQILDMVKQLYIQQREFGIQQQQMQEDFALQRSRAWEDFHRNRQRAEEDFQKQRKRGAEDFKRAETYAITDFNKSRRRQEKDFNHQRVLMAEQAAKQMYDIYQRVYVQRTMSGSNLLSNGADQLRRMQQQSSNLNTARRAGVSDNVIQQLGLTDPKNAQQLERFVEDITDNPKLVKEFNKQIESRIKAAKKIVEDDSSTEWQELTRQYRLARSRAEKDFNTSLARGRKQFRISLSRQNEDFSISMARQQEDMGRQMDRSAADFAKSQDRARKAMDRSVKDLFTSGEDLLETAMKTMDRGTRKQIRSILDNLGEVGSKGGRVLKEVRELWDGILPGIFGSGKGSGNSNAIPKLIDKLMPKTPSFGPKSYGSDRAMANRGGEGGSMGGGHDHGPTCGHVGGSMGVGLPPVTSSGQGGPTSSSAGDSGRRAGGSSGSKWQYPLKAPITSPFGMRRHPVTGVYKLHDGVDFGAPNGTPYGAIADGTVRVVSTGWGGRVPYIDHGGGITSFYGHSSSLSVGSGDKVRKGQRVGAVGSVGFSTGPHLHMGTMRNGQFFDPMSLLKGAGVGKLYGSASIAADENRKLPLKRRYDEVEDAAEETELFKDGAISNAFNRAFKKVAKEAGRETEWARNGGIFAHGPKMVGVGEGGPELALPLNNQGLQFISQLMGKLEAPKRNNAVGSQPVMHNNTYNYRVDKSTNFSGAITVVSNDPNEFIRKMRADARYKALTQPVLVGSN